MQKLFLKSRSPFIGSALLLTALLLTACGAVKPITEATIDETADGLQLQCNHYDAKSKTKYGYAHYNNDVVIQIEVYDKANQQQYLNSGTRIYIDETGKKKKDNYLLLPSPGNGSRNGQGGQACPPQGMPPMNMNAQGEQGMPTSNNQMGSRSNKSKMEIPGLDGMSKYDHLNKQTELIYDNNTFYLSNPNDNLGVSSTLSENDGKLIHQITIPQSLFNGEALSIGIVGGKSSQPQGRMQSSPGGMNSGGMGGGPSGMGGGPGGMGGAPGGSSGPGTATSQTQASNIWFLINLHQ